MKKKRGVRGVEGKVKSPCSLDKAGVEGLASEVLVVLLDVLLGSVDHLEVDQLEATALKAGDNLSGESALDLSKGESKVSRGAVKLTGQ